MEQPSEDRLERLRFNLLLQRIALLPLELQKPILLDLNYPEIKALCKYSSHKDALEKLKMLSAYCQDANFWRDYLLEQGFILPEKFVELVTFLKPTKVSEADFLQQLFLGDRKTRELIRERLIRRWSELVSEPQEDAPTGPIRQYLLDFDYLWRQIDDYYWRKRSSKPRIFEVNIDNLSSQNRHYGVILRAQDKPTFDELLEVFVQNDIKIMPRIYSLVSLWLYNFLGLRRQYYTSDSTFYDFLNEFEEQALVLIGDLLQEGDLLEINFTYYGLIDEALQTADRIYFYFDGRKLINVGEFTLYRPKSKTVGILPEEAISYLIRKKVSTLEDLHELYILDDRDYLQGFNYKDDLYFLLSNKISPATTLVIDNHTFSAKQMQ